ncbi:uncharacterized protein LOC117156459 [Bombus vancouverensis nearcticus]|uniref:uncharacterized protein LOC117156459 n=1 Tax=Bombus vancouverensis nearcticus TaxID=2705178 RepID=UPI001439134E|nr:uncharacterized protein LOC117156459 [Bombus vancouverensis nearcticus]
MLEEAHRQNAVKPPTIYKWVKGFEEGRENVEDQHRFQYRPYRSENGHSSNCRKVLNNPLERGNVLFVRERGRRETKLFLDRKIIKIICIHRHRCAIRHLVWNVIRFRCYKQFFSEWYPEERVANILKLASQGNSKLTLFHEFFPSGQNRKPQSEDTLSAKQLLC